LAFFGRRSVALALRQDASLSKRAVRANGRLTFSEGRPLTSPQNRPDHPPASSGQPDRLPDLTSLQAHFLAIVPRIELHARVYFRHLRCHDKRADAIAETVAVAWKWYLRIAEQRREINDFVSTLARYAASHVRCGRRLCGQERSKDVLSFVAQRKHGFTVQTLPEYETGVEGNEAIDALRDNTRTPPPEQAAFRIDYPRWLSQLPSRNRRIAQDMALGESTQALAACHGVSQARISPLRRELHRDWRRFHREID
jgi:hypothetical protein